MIKDVVRGTKVDPFWVGPYSVLKVTRAGTYTLLDSTGRLLGRTVPKDQVKFVAGPPDPDVAQAIVDRSFVVDKILRHRGIEGAREYLVRWRDYGAEADTWEPEKNFEDRLVIQSYWDSLI